MSETLKIYKMSGSGNDFVIIDNRTNVVAEEAIPGLAREICARRISVGADGLILIEDSDSADFRMRIFNADGSEAEMCGNGSRCVCLIAEELGVASGSMSFETLAGVIRGTVTGDSVGVQMTDIPDVTSVSLSCPSGPVEGVFLNSGVPHVVIPVDDLAGCDVVTLGREIHRHECFQPAGTNVNFLENSEGSSISIRTYERGVEDETLACGTGAVASAAAYAHLTGAAPPISVLTRGGDTLVISFERDGDTFTGVTMEGPVRKVFEGIYVP